MDSFNRIRVDDASGELIGLISVIQPISGKYVPLAQRRIAISQMLEDRWQLYEMFCWNYDRYAEGLESYVNDRVMTSARCRNADIAFQRTWADVNCFAANLISAGVTLTESFRCFMGSEVDECCEERRRFEDYLAELFDKGGVYPLMTKLRDEAQHGQPLVSLCADSEGSLRASFDLDQLLRPEHFSIKGAFRDMMEKKTVQMDEIGAHHHRISYTWCMERYFIEVLKIASLFQSCSSMLVKNLDSSFSDFIRCHRECCGELPNGCKIAILHEDGDVHVLADIDVPLYQIQTKRQSAIAERLVYAESRYSKIVSKVVGPSR